MPQWLVLLAIAVFGWLAFAIGLGLLLGRLIDLGSRRLPRRRRAIGAR